MRCHALVVGINRYGRGIAGLSSAVNDARAIATALREQHGYSVDLLVDDEASREAILAQLTRAAGELDAEQGFLFYFAGHGLAMGDGNQGPQGYLLPQDAQAGDETGWLSMQALRTALEALPCRHMLVVLDCCFAGAFRWSSTRDAILVGHPLFDSQLARYLQGDAWQALTSASHVERAADSLPGRHNTRDEGSEQGHSPFADAFLKGLSGGADSARKGFEPDGVITVTELYQYVFESLVPPGAQSMQTPGLWPLKPGNTGEYVFRCPGSALRTLPDPPLDEANNPWLGLRAYSSAEAELFFGREDVIAALRQRIDDPASGNLVVVVGASGSGKSSVVRAGLLPQLRAQPGAWQIVESARLRAKPMQQLDAAMASFDASQPGRQLLLIDQFEELYTQCPDPEQRSAFLGRLRALAESEGGPLLILTLRSDFEPSLAACSELADLLPAARFLVPAFSTESLRRVIDGPMQVKALYMDPPELVDTLLDEVAAMPGALPLLSFALAETYRHAEQRRRSSGSADRALTAADYAATGGVLGGLHRRASAILAKADPACQQSIRRLFLRMVSQEGARLTRRRVSLDELEVSDPAEQERLRKVIDQYVAARLLIIDQGFVEPAHDTLVVAWQDLQEWLANSPQQPLQRAAWRAARDWQAGGFGAGMLWDNDPRLPQLVAMLPELNLLERRFAQRSMVRRGRRRRRIAVGTVSLVLVLLVMLGYAIDRAEEADRQAAAALEQLAEARYANGKALLAQSAQAYNASDYLGAAFHGASAIGFRHFGIDPAQAGEDAPPELIRPEHPEHREAILQLSQAALNAPRLVAWRPLGRALFSADGQRLVGINTEGRIELRDFSAERLILIDPVQGRPESLLLSEDGSTLVTPLADGIAVWKLDAAASASPLILSLPGAARSGPLALDPRGRRLAAADGERLLLWDLGRPKAPPKEISLKRSQGIGLLSSLRFSADGSLLFAGGWHDRILLIEESAFSATLLASGARPGVRSIGPEWTLWSENIPKGDYVRALAPSADGQRLLVASANRVLIGESTPSGLRIADDALFDTRREITQLSLSADGSRAVLADSEALRLLSVPSGQGASLLWPAGFEAGALRELQFVERGGLLMLASEQRMELFDVSALGRTGGLLDTLDFAETLPPAGNVGDLEALVASGEIDLLGLAFPDPDARPPGMSMQVDTSDDGLVVSFSGPSDREGFDHIEDFGSMRVALQPGTEPLLALGMDRFHKNRLRPGRDPEIEMYRLGDAAPVFIRLLDELDEWGIDRFRFSDDGQQLLVSISNFDGYERSNYAFPTLRHDYTRYLSDQPCAEPGDLRKDHWLLGTELMDCPTN